LPRSLRVRSRKLCPELNPTREIREYPPLNLQPGEIVEVRSQQEIESTLDPDNKRGPHFHSGMLLDCGTRARVVGRVDRIIDERTGRMLKLHTAFVDSEKRLREEGVAEAQRSHAP
jgi:hypothetical protein